MNNATTVSDKPDDEVVREKRDVRITMRVPRRLRVAMRRLAARDRRSLSDWLIVVLEDVVAAENSGATIKKAHVTRPKKGADSNE